jgi:hypothetical protein
VNEGERENLAVTVFSTGDTVELITAKLLLDGEQIPYVVMGEGVHHLFGLGAVVGTYNMITGPVQLRVHYEDVERAREALEDLRAPSE